MEKTNTDPTLDPESSLADAVPQSALTVRRSNDRGQADHGWLKAKHSFSFASYHDPDHMGFRSLRVINEDQVAPNGGFPLHPHNNMEIFSYIVSGQIKHQDTMGNERVLGPGDIQLMSAGSGIQHAEMNPSDTEPLHLLQIWITPNQPNLKPSYTEQLKTENDKPSTKTLIISPDGLDSSAIIHQDASVYRIQLSTDQSTTHFTAPSRATWLQVIKGQVTINGITLAAGDAVSTETAGQLNITTSTNTEALLFDLA